MKKNYSWSALPIHKSAFILTLNVSSWNSLQLGIQTFFTHFNFFCISLYSQRNLLAMKVESNSFICIVGSNTWLNKYWNKFKYKKKIILAKNFNIDGKQSNFHISSTFVLRGDADITQWWWFRIDYVYRCEIFTLR